ncbi:alpha/beta-hydrolase [Tricholoma matsutake]|nr:alpha/beta-hydrolase [Tricholoma matsutake 945]
MDNSLYKELKVDRGFNYRYYFSPPTDGKPILLFLHGFPSSSHDWVRQIEHFQPRGYGILAPDMLGSGRTDRPLDINAFRTNPMAKDIIDILNEEKIKKVVGVAHDFGCATLSRLALLSPDRFIAFGWLAVSFQEPLAAKFDLKQVMAHYKQLFGREILAYWEFFNRKDSSGIIEKNIDSFIQLLYPRNTDDWYTYMATPGKTAEWLENNMKPGFAEYLTKNDIDIIRQEILDGGISSALNYYKAIIQNIGFEDSLNFNRSWVIEQPCFFAAAHNDPICSPVRLQPMMERHAKDLKIIDCYTGHWLHFEASHQLNDEFEAWLRNKVITS